MQLAARPPLASDGHVAQVAASQVFARVDQIVGPDAEHDSGEGLFVVFAKSLAAMRAIAAWAPGVRRIPFGYECDALVHGVSIEAIRLS